MPELLVLANLLCYRQIGLGKPMVASKDECHVVPDRALDYLFKVHYQQDHNTHKQLTAGTNS